MIYDIEIVVYLKTPALLVGGAGGFENNITYLLLYTFSIFGSVASICA